MLGMATFSFYNEIQISECPPTLYDLKDKIKELYNLDETQKNNCVISYADNQGEKYYILDEDQYEECIPKIESIVLKIEISDNDKYLTIDPIYEEEFDVRYDSPKKKETDNPTEGFYYDYYDLETITGDEEKDNVDINIHNGIECTLCGCENIKGIRYLCGICENYNLCQECETQFGVEHGHPLLKIRNPELTPLSFGYKINKK